MTNVIVIWIVVLPRLIFTVAARIIIIIIIVIVSSFLDLFLFFLHFQLQRRLVKILLLNLRHLLLQIDLLYLLRFCEIKLRD